jgi:RimJ/RimL family protein N-acetyltransferase
MKVEINEDLWFEEFSWQDAEALVRNLNDEEIHKTMLELPHPYTEQHARDWIHFNSEARTKLKIPQHFGIFVEEEGLIGGIGMKQSGQSSAAHQAEVGYYLARPYWGNGIMTLALKAYSRWLFEQTSLVRLTAIVFKDNKASEKVLQNCGYQLEGKLRKHVLKDGNYIDCSLFALIRDDVPGATLTQYKF